jgi:hypothetical protein
LAAKGWLATYDHPTGPGTPGFDQAINQQLYNKKLTMLCTKGTAITYLRKAAEFDGWGAGQQLRLRYHGFSKQRGKTLKTTIENIRHVNGTNITTHIDLFEKLITQISYNDPLHPPSEEQKIDWFLDSVTERTYDSVQASWSAENIEGKLTFQKMVKIFTHKCFQRYPDFHIRELANSKDKFTLTNNSTTVMNRGRYGYGRGRGKGQNTTHPPGHLNKGQKGQRVSKGKGKGRTNGLRGYEKGRERKISITTSGKSQLCPLWLLVTLTLFAKISYPSLLVTLTLFAKISALPKPTCSNLPLHSFASLRSSTHSL